MAANALDRISREYETDARRYIATLIVVGGAKRHHIVSKLAEKFNTNVTTRTITNWQNNDPELVAMIRDLEAIKRDATPGEDVALPAPVNRAQIDDDFFSHDDDFPAWGDLVARDAGRQEEQTATAWGEPLSPAAEPDDDDASSPDYMAVILAEHSPEEFDAHCKRLLGEPPEPVPTAGAGSLS